MSWRDIRTLYTMELRSAFRERSIVVNSVLLPIFLYPLLLWVMFSALTFVEGLAEGFTTRVVVVGTAPVRATLVDSLRAMETVDLRDEPEALDAAEEAVREGELDAVLELLPAGPGGDALEDNFRARILFDGSVERSRRARQRLEGLVDRHRERWMAAEGERLGLPEAERIGFQVMRRDVASERDRGAFLLAQMIPLFLVIMVALGCFVPSVDTTAGERERSTWETTMTLGTSRMNLVAAKYLYVATLGILAGALNVAAVMLSVGSFMRPILQQTGDAFEFSIAPMAVLVLLAGALVLALFFAAAMMLLAAFARTFKDGQAMVTPVYWLVFIPLLMGDRSDLHLDATLALIPVANVTLMMRDAILGVFVWPYMAEAVLVTMVMVVLLLVLARWILSFEDFLLGSHDGSFWTFLKERASALTRPSARQDAA